MLGAGSTSASGPTSAPSSGDGCAAASSRSTDKREKRNRKRRERKQRAKARPDERSAAVEADESKEEDDDGDTHLHPSEDGTVMQMLPARLVTPGATKEEYARRLAAARQSGGVVSVGTFRKLATLVEEDMLLVEAAGRDWASEYGQLMPVMLRVCVSDADLPYDDDSYSDDDVNLMDVL